MFGGYLTNEINPKLVLTGVGVTLRAGEVIQGGQRSCEIWHR